jgi:hypothetical protein
VELNPLLLELLFPWLRGANLRIADIFTSAISLPDCRADVVLTLVENCLRKEEFLCGC